MFIEEHICCEISNNNDIQMASKNMVVREKQRKVLKCPLSKTDRIGKMEDLLVV